ncbi:hypothetical protein [Brevibacillus sp. NRS-1366]|uniref:hypothetical protein n=1 Tax=Brevibacillus sp. NRS-1366 TaxID=3233899 RepID=UPI003D1F60B3
MQRIIKFVLVGIMIALFCLNPIQLPRGTETSLEQSLFMEYTPFVEHATFYKENNQVPSFVTILLLFCLFISFFYVFYRSKIRSYLLSCIPVLKNIFLLFPIKFESRYIVQSHFI